jgi:signal transduction histidine kinase
MQSIKNWYKIISRIGIDNSLSVYKRKRLLVFNKISIAVFLLSIVWFIYFTFFVEVHPSFSVVLLNLVPAITTIVSCFFVYKKKYKIAIYTNTIVIPFILCVVSFVLQEGSLLFYLMIYSIFPFIYHTKFLKIVLHFLYVVSLYACTLYFFKLHLPTNQIIFSPTLQIAGIIFLFFVMYFVKMQVISYENLLKQNKEELDFKNKELMKMLILKDQIFTVVSHDIIVPLHSMKMITNHIIECGYNSERIEELFPMMRDEVIKTHGLFTNLLDWSKAQQEGRGNITTDVVMVDIANRVLEQTHSQASLKGITVVNEMDSDLIADVNADNLMVAIRNLIVNAIKFTAPQGTITISTVETEHFVQININDTGFGMDSATMQLLFSKELHTSLGTSSETGNGFGLKISNELIKQNGGSVFCENSIQGQGSTFAIRMPKGSPKEILTLQEAS